jgi:hypothetical protein
MVVDPLIDYFHEENRSLNKNQIKIWMKIF